MERGVSPSEVVMKTSVADMHLLPSNIDLSGAEVQLVHEVGREFVLGGVLEPLLPDYDIVLIDCQPSLGLLTVNALACSDGIIVPLECEYFAMRGVALLTETIDKVSRRINPRLHVDGLLATMYDSRTLHSREVLSRVVDRFGDRGRMVREAIAALLADLDAGVESSTLARRLRESAASPAAGPAPAGTS